MKQKNNNWLYEKYDFLQEEGYLKDIPQDVLLSLKNPLREYQEQAVKRFIHNFEDSKTKQNHILFEMATGSGKTLTMAAIILYLYTKGYEKFVFFVNSTTIIEKTKVNFSATTQNKSLFKEEIELNNTRVNINIINSFDDATVGDINIIFTTIQGLHTTLNAEKENSLSFDDFKNHQIVLIADEAHHLSGSTKEKKQLDMEKLSWENTVNKIFSSNNGNILLEFTATSGINDESIKDKYQDKLIFKYSLKEFCEDKYSKTIAMIVSRTENKYRILIALFVNIFREELLSTMGLSIKPVILFKSENIARSKSNEEELLEIIQNLSKKDIEDTIDLIKSNQEDSPLLKKLLSFFKEHSITTEILIGKIKNKIKAEYILNANDDREKENHQLILNSLEDYNNKIRVIFAVDKLNEGWDVLNLFDIVKLYNTKNPKTTTKETQLIGRGARYYPFLLNEEGIDNKYKRKFDDDAKNPLRFIEQLHYHTSDEVAFIKNLNKDLEQEGLILEENLKEIPLNLSENFINSDIYNNGLIILNKKQQTKDIKINQQQHRQGHLFNKEITIQLPKEQYHIGYEIKLKIEEHQSQELDKKVLVSEYKESKILKLKDIEFAIFYKAIAKNGYFSFDKIKYLGLGSIKDIYEFYGESSINFLFDKKQNEQKITASHKLAGVLKLLEELEKDLQITEYIGSEFKVDYSKKIAEVFTNKTLLIPKTKDLYDDKVVNSKYLGQDSFSGTSLENELVLKIEGYLKERATKFKEIFLIRNEGHFTIYNYRDGRGFQPDFVLFLQKQNGDVINYQLFIEPKGEHIASFDAWKENFLEEINKKSTNKDITIAKQKQIIRGLPFYNEKNINKFIEQLEEIIE